jgi:hypothetical protein
MRELEKKQYKTRTAVTITEYLDRAGAESLA